MATLAAGGRSRAEIIARALDRGGGSRHLALRSGNVADAIAKLFGYFRPAEEALAQVRALLKPQTSIWIPSSRQWMRA
jgi:hypothetical protein